MNNIFLPEYPFSYNLLLNFFDSQQTNTTDIIEISRQIEIEDKIETEVSQEQQQLQQQQVIRTINATKINYNKLKSKRKFKKKSKQKNDFDGSTRSSFSFSYAGNINNKISKDKQRNSSASNTNCTHPLATTELNTKTEKNLSEPIISSTIINLANQTDTQSLQQHKLQHSQSDVLQKSRFDVTKSNTSNEEHSQLSEYDEDDVLIDDLSCFENCTSSTKEPNSPDDTQPSPQSNLNQNRRVESSRINTNKKKFISTRMTIKESQSDDNYDLMNTSGLSYKNDANLPPLPPSTSTFSPFASTNNLNTSTASSNTSELDRNIYRRSKRNFTSRHFTPCTTININNHHHNTKNNLTKAISTPSIIENICENDTNSNHDARLFKRADKCTSLQSNTPTNYEVIQHLVNLYDSSKVLVANGEKSLTKTNKDLVTIDEFLKEYDTNDNKSNNQESFSSSTLKHSQSHIQYRSLSEHKGTYTSCTLLPHQLLPTQQQHYLTNAQSEQNISSSTKTPLINQTSSSQINTKSCPTNNNNNQTSTKFDNSSNKVISKTRKFGQIFKLASVRGAKSKSIKHKLSVQIQQHSFTTINSENTCVHCKKSLASKKAVYCKNCYICVHDNECKNDVLTSISYKCTKQNNTNLKTITTSTASISTTTAISTSMNTIKDQDEAKLISFKRDQFSITNRPKSMDISKIFNSNLSKSTSNMYRSFSIPVININEVTNTSTSYGLFGERKSSKRFSFKSINEESNEFEAIKVLRDSVESLNLKYDDKTTTSAFNQIFADINAEFSKYEFDFSVENWADLQIEEFLKTLNKQTRNKQENIYEFCKTEINYVKVLTITQRIYVNAIVQDCKIDKTQLEKMFPALDNLIDLHTKFLTKLIERYKTGAKNSINSIGDIVLEFLNLEHERIVSIYTKFCCFHLIAKNTFKKLIEDNKSLALFLQETQKHAFLRRYQIPDCLTIITQRLAKHLTLIENMVNNSRNEKNDNEKLILALEKLRKILTSIDDAVAIYQNANEFYKIFENIDLKTQTFVIQNKLKEQRRICRDDLNSNSDRKYLCIKQVTVKCASKNNKVYKDVTCLTMTDMIIFLQLNDKNKYVFMNEHSIVPFTNGILIRPRSNEILNNRTTSTSGLNSSLPSYIVNTITNEIIEIKFTDESSRIQWLNLVHTHVTPFIEESLSKEETPTNIETFIANGKSNETKQSAQLKNQNSLSTKELIKTFRPDIYSSTCSLASIESKKQNLKLNEQQSIENENIEINKSHNMSQEMANLIFNSFNHLIEQTFNNNGNLMRSASSAGETTTSRSNSEINIPKRAETFNGASSNKETNMIDITINELLKTKLSYKHSISSSCCIVDCTHGNHNNQNPLPHSHTNSEISAADSGYHSRLCVDINHDNDTESCNCSCSINSQKSNNKLQYEDLIKHILIDYKRIKEENLLLKNQIEKLKQKNYEENQDQVEQNINTEKAKHDNNYNNHQVLKQHQNEDSNDNSNSNESNILFL